MLVVDIPGEPPRRLEHLILDYNGTLAVDGELLPGLAGDLAGLAERLTMHVVTGDTFGKAERQLSGLPCRLTVLPTVGQARAKLAYAGRLGFPVTACIGNGRNDRLLLEHCALGIAVIQAEGAALSALLAADVAVRDIREAIGLLLNPRRLVATLRH